MSNRGGTEGGTESEREEELGVNGRVTGEKRESHGRATGEPQESLRLAT